VPHDNVTRLIQPETFDDQLTQVLRNGAKALLAKAVSPSEGALGSRSRGAKLYRQMRARWEAVHRATDSSSDRGPLKWQDQTFRVRSYFFV